MKRYILILILICSTPLYSSGFEKNGEMRVVVMDFKVKGICGPGLFLRMPYKFHILKEILK